MFRQVLLKPSYFLSSAITLLLSNIVWGFFSWDSVMTNHPFIQCTTHIIFSVEKKRRSVINRLREKKSFIFFSAILPLHLLMKSLKLGAFHISLSARHSLVYYFRSLLLCWVHKTGFSLRKAFFFLWAFLGEIFLSLLQ